MSRSSKSGDTAVHLVPTRFIKTGPLLLAGLRRRFDATTRPEIADLWHEVGPQFAKLPAQVGEAGYGLCFAADADNDKFEYMAATEVARAHDLPPRWTHLTLPAQRYAVFPHEGPLEEIADTVGHIFQDWLPGSESARAGGRNQPDFVEHYGEGFNPATGTGDIEIWVPLKD